MPKHFNSGLRLRRVTDQIRAEFFADCEYIFPESWPKIVNDVRRKFGKASKEMSPTDQSRISYASASFELKGRQRGIG